MNLLEDSIALIGGGLLVKAWDFWATKRKQGNDINTEVSDFYRNKFVELTEDFDRMRNKVEEMARRIDALEQEGFDLRKENRILKEENHALRLENIRLQEQLFEYKPKTSER